MESSCGWDRSSGLLGEIKNDDRWDASRGIKRVEAKEGKNGKDNIKLTMKKGGVKLKQKEGLEGLTKRRFVKEVIRQENPDIVFFYGNQRSEFRSRKIASIWKRRRVEREVFEVESMSGGILVLCNSRSVVSLKWFVVDIPLLLLFWMATVKNFGSHEFMAPRGLVVEVCFGRSWEIFLVMVGRDGA
ncbi:hypothetical protein E5676_scaffold1970G00440 [Cucumis melo var. makuwa]|uniref:Uncharacterized protein n=1 Tax=Cucumis melo var. makuwa TaxID=1194695 RepID=A0A5D3BBR6_CUCMM|nr:hypothetical protein E5676_scaffold1970G00440 [Cucumis melo var. makuwa]